MESSCPHCGAADLEIEAGGGVQRCRACGRSALRGTRRRSIGPGEVRTLPAAGLALAATILFFAALRLLPDSRLAELFLERGWVQYAITFISFWALALLAAKRRLLVRERRMLERDWLDRSGSPDGESSAPNGRRGALVPDQVDPLLARLASESGFDFDSLLGRRLVRALRHFQARRQVVEVVEFLSVESRADEGRIDASHALIRVFIWAVPTLGFIGTVIGIGSAVAGFSTTLETAASIESMRESIASVTGGLGVAFDTTLLALVMSILVMFPSSALQRLEERFLAEVDDYCSERLVRRLVDEGPASGRSGELEALLERLLAALQARDGGSGR